MKRRDFAKLIAVAMFIFALAPIGVAARAAELGITPVWHSTASVIGRFYSRPSVCYKAQNGFVASTFNSNVSHALKQWNDNGIRSTTQSEYAGADVLIYGGTFATMKLVIPAIFENYGGKGIISSEAYEGTWLVQSDGSFRDGYRIYQSKVVVISDPKKSDGTPISANYKNVITHEVGHAFGWSGHSASSSDIMYKTETSRITPSANDVAHIGGVIRY